MNITTVPMKITEYSVTQAAMIALAERMKGVVYDVTTTAGMKVAKADRAEIRELRFALEEKRKELKAPALERSRLIDGEAKALTEQLLALETPVDAQIKLEEQKKEDARIAREKIEADRKALIARRLVAMHALIGFAQEQTTSASVQKIIDDLTDDDLEGFDEFSAEANNGKRDVLTRLAAIRQMKYEAEDALAKAKEANAIEAKRLAELQAKIDAEHAEALRLEAIRAAAAKKESDRVAAEAAALKKAQDELEAAKKKLADDAAKAERERLDAEAAAERARLDAEAAARRKAQQEADARLSKIAQLAPRMLAVLQTWKHNYKDVAEMVAAHLERDAILAEIGDDYRSNRRNEGLI